MSEALAQFAKEAPTERLRDALVTFAEDRMFGPWATYTQSCGVTPPFLASITREEFVFLLKVIGTLAK